MVRLGLVVTVCTSHCTVWRWQVGFGSHVRVTAHCGDGRLGLVVMYESLHTVEMAWLSLVVMCESPHTVCTGGMAPNHYPSKKYIGSLRSRSKDRNFLKPISNALYYDVFASYQDGKMVEYLPQPSNHQISPSLDCLVSA